MLEDAFVKSEYFHSLINVKNYLLYCRCQLSPGMAIASKTFCDNCYASLVRCDNDLDHGFDFFAIIKSFWCDIIAVCLRLFIAISYLSIIFLRLETRGATTTLLRGELKMEIFMTSFLWR